MAQVETQEAFRITPYHEKQKLQQLQLPDHRVNEVGVAWSPTSASCARCQTSFLGDWAQWLGGIGAGRPHHCRRCGRTVCHACSPSTAPLPPIHLQIGNFRMIGEEFLTVIVQRRFEVLCADGLFSPQPVRVCEDCARDLGIKKFLTDLPDALLLDVMRLLEFQDLFQLACCNRAFYKLSKSEVLKPKRKEMKYFLEGIKLDEKSPKPWLGWLWGAKPEFKFQTQYSAEHRAKMLASVHAKHPNRVPVVLEFNPSNSKPIKLLVPPDMLLHNVIAEGRKKAALPAYMTSVPYIDGRLIQASISIGALYKKLKDEDGFLYIWLQTDKELAFDKESEPARA